MSNEQNMENQPKGRKAEVLDKLKKNKGKVFALTVLAVLVLGALNNKDNGEKAASNVGYSKVDTGKASESVDPEYAEDVREANRRAAAEAEERGGNFMGTLPPKSLSEQDMFKTASAPTDDLAGNAASAPAVNVANPEQYQTRVEVHEIKTIKEVPVPVDVKYDWRKDPSLINYFDNEGVAGGQGMTAAGTDLFTRGASGSASNQQNGINNTANVEITSNGRSVYSGSSSISADGVQGGVAGSGSVSGAAGYGFGANQSQQQQAQVTLAKVGDLSPSILQTKIVSTNGGSVVRGQIVAGTLKGGVLTGTYTQQGNAVSINFKTLNLPGVSQSIPINAVALDYNEASTALASSVNRYIFPRLLGTLVTAFGARYAQILSGNNSYANSRSVVNEITGNATQIIESGSNPKTTKQIFREAGAQTISEGANMLNGLIPTEAKVTVDSNLPFGLYFTSDLIVDKKIADEMENQRMFGR